MKKYLFLLLLIPFIVSAQSNVLTIPLSDAETRPVVFSTEIITDPNKIFVRVNEDIKDDVMEMINKSFIKPQDIFYADFSRFTNLIANVSNLDGKILYFFDLLPGEGDVYLGDSAIVPLLDSTPVKSTEFDVQNNRIIFNKKHVFDYSNIAEKSDGKEIVFVGIKSPANSYLQYKVSEYVLYPTKEKIRIEFWDDNEKYSIIAQTNIRNQDGFFEIYDENGTHPLKVSPEEIYMESLKSANRVNGVELENIELMVYKGSAVYKISTKEKFKLFALIPFEIKSQYYISVGSDDVLSMEEVRPFYTLLGTGNSFKVTEVVNNIIGLTTQQLKDREKLLEE